MGRAGRHVHFQHISCAFVAGVEAGTGPVSVVIADDEASFRDVLRRILDADGGIAVLDEASDGAAAVRLAEALAPDVVVLDIRMPGVDGVAAAGAIKALVPQTVVVMLTVSDDEDDLFESLRAGASGYLRKDLDLDGVPAAIRSIASGQFLLGGSLWSMVRARLLEDDDPAPTPRQSEVLELLRENLTNRQIAERLYISELTAKRHVSDIMAKFHQSTRQDAVRFAKAQGLLP